MPTTRTPRRSARSAALREFLETEIAGGVALFVAAAVALLWANGPWSGGYEALWSTRLGVRLGERAIDLSLHDWVNEGAMAVFFLVVGLEVKREVVLGELRDPRRAAVPVIAALGGMVVPAVLYVVLVAGGDGTRGWGVPMATDIAFALGALALVGPRAPAPLKLFLLTLAVVDDIGAIVVIAVVYSTGVSGAWLLASLGILVVAVALRALRVAWMPAYVCVGVALWLALHEAGVHATIAGVAMGLLTPTSPPRGRTGPSPVERLEHALHPWSSFLIVPVFALANAGVPVGVDALGDAATSRVALGVLVGLVLGKIVGVTGFTWLACRAGIGRRPAGASWRDIAGVGALAGIGFTVSLFVADLAYDDPALADEARIGILVAGVVAAAVGALLLRRPQGASR